MELTVSEEAANWYKNELELEENVDVRFFVRYGGVGGRIPGFSLGINIESPDLVHTSTTVNKLHFFIAEEDAWYFEDENLDVTMNDKLDEPQFTYPE